MAYTRRNRLERIIDIQQIVLDHTNNGVTQEWVFENKIKPVYKISRSTFYAYLGTNAKKQLKDLENNFKNQLNLF